MREDIEPIAMKLREAAAMLGLDVRQFRALEDKGLIRGVRAGGVMLYSVEALKAFLVAAAPEPAAALPAWDGIRTYFIQAGDGGPIKIGVSSRIRLRMIGMQVDCPLRLKLLGFINADREEELHEMFSGYRVLGEWFEPGVALLAFIEREATKP